MGRLVTLVFGLSGGGENAGWGRAHEFGGVEEFGRPALGAGHANSVAPQNFVN